MAVLLSVKTFVDINNTDLLEPPSMKLARDKFRSILQVLKTENSQYNPITKSLNSRSAISIFKNSLVNNNLLKIHLKVECKYIVQLHRHS